MKKQGYSEPFRLDDQYILRSNIKRLILTLSLAIILISGIIASKRLNELPPAFNGNVNVYALQNDPENYDISHADGAASVMVSENLAKTNAKNVCFSVVFNFRGYDTMGESFILIAALSGSMCILRNIKKKKEKKASEVTE